ncbi:MAG TPA: hypothetical protein VLM40_02700, partial [Gemmata sp.]|nr:hypothetical protein [Gemmata sp.]
DVPDIGAEEGEGGHKPGVHARLFDNAGDTPLGSEFLLSLYLAAEDAPTAAAADAQGNYVVVYQSWEDAGDNSGFGIYAKLFSADGKPIDLNGNGIDDDAMLVNTTTLSSQSNPSVASDGAGNFVVVWQSARQDGDGYGIFARKFNGFTKQWTGPEFQVNATTAGDQTNPKVAMDGAGNFTVVWQSPDADGTGIFGRRFLADGTPDPAGEFQVNTVSDTNQVEPSIAMNAAGQFVVAWVSDHNQDIVDGENIDTEKSIFARWFDAAGVASGPEFLVNTYTKDAQEHPAVGIDKSGNFVVAWQSINQEMNVEGIGQSWGVYARQFAVSGTGVVTPVQDQEFRVNETADGSQRFPTVGMNQNGEFVVVWQSIPQEGSGGGGGGGGGESTGGSWGIYGRQYAADGTPTTPETHINTYTMGPQILPVVAERGSGDFGIFWSGQGTGHVDGAFGQRFHWIRDDFDKGGNQPSLGPDWTVRIGNYDIHDNQAAVVSDTGFATLNQVFLRNVSLEAQVTLGGGVVQSHGLVARYTGGSSPSYYVARIRGDEGIFTAQILRYVNGVKTVLASAPVSVGTGLIRFDLVRSSLKMYLNGKLVASAYDSTIRSAGLMGITGRMDAAMDNFTYTPLEPISAVLPFADSFNVANGSPLSSFWSEQVGVFAVNNAKLGGIGSVNLATLNGVMAANAAVEATVDVTNGRAAGLVARHQGNQDTDMYLGQLVNRAGSYFAMISKNVNGVWTRLAEVAVGSGSGVLRFETVGSSLKLFVDGTLVAEATDSTFGQPGQFGLRSGLGETFDDFSVAAL